MNDIPGKIPDRNINPRGFGEGSEPEPIDEDIATETEQQDYDLLTVRARKVIYGTGKENILRMLGSSASPAEGMGKTGAMIIKSLVQSGKQGGRDMAPSAILESGGDVIDDLNELAKANAVFQYDTPEDEERELADAMLWGVKFYGDGMMSAGEITPEMQDSARQEVQAGMAEEQGMSAAPPAPPAPSPVAAGVNSALRQPKPPGNAQNPGLVGKNMMGGY